MLWHSYALRSAEDSQISPVAAMPARQEEEPMAEDRIRKLEGRIKELENALASRQRPEATSLNHQYAIRRVFIRRR